VSAEAPEERGIARVAVPVPLRETFSYRVPAALAGRIEPGARVRVPFGARRLVGVVFALEAGDATGLKDVEAVLDDGPPALAPDVLRLVRWATDYYIAAPGEMARAALPPSHARPGRRMCVPTDAARCAAGEGTAPPWLKDFVARGEAQAPAGLTPAQRRTALAAGWLHEEMRVPERRAREVKRVCVREEGGDAGVLVRAPARAEVYAAVRDAGARGVTLVELVARFKGAEEKVRALAVAGLVEVTARPAPSRAVARATAAATGAAGGAALALTPAQDAALATIRAALESGRFAPCLLHGVTGSGKTEIYLRAGLAARERGRGVLMLVPEIGLTPALTTKLVARFGADVAVLHSSLTDAERAEAWRRVREGAVRVVVGARSAVFAPVADLGLIVIDEEHDGAFKQGSAPCYSARDLALVRAQQTGVAIVLGSATPAIETYHHARSGRTAYLALPERVEARPLPAVELIDLKEHFGAGPSGVPLLTRPLKDALVETVRAREQAILFLNRRGFSTFVICKECRYAFKCMSCDVAMTYHRRADRLRCHYCGVQSAVPVKCPKCRGPHLALLGRGTERIEDAVADTLDEAGLGRHGIARMDRDTTSARGAVEALLERFGAGDLRVLVGTQMVAKGHDFPGVTLVGVVTADTALGLPDFRASERTFQLVTQVAGRAGRGARPGRVLVQTFDPTQPAVRCAATHDYAAFAAEELEARRALGYPPFVRLVALLVAAADPRVASEVAERLGAAARRQAEGPFAAAWLRVLGPVTAPLSRLRGESRHRLLFKGTDHRALRDFTAAVLREVPVPRGASVAVDVDPQDLL
jgi:primosomal protein N' (replication factor Y)